MIKGSEGDAGRVKVGGADLGGGFRVHIGTVTTMGEWGGELGEWRCGECLIRGVIR